MPARSRIVEEKRPKRQKKKSSAPLDSPTLMIVFLLLVTGLIALFTASYSMAHYNDKISTPLFYVIRQGLFGAIGIIIMFFLSNLDYHIYKVFSVPIFIVATILLILVIIPGIGTEINDARRWIYIGPFNFQPSEIMKTAIIIGFASFAESNKEIKKFTKGTLPFLAVLGLVAALLKFQPHLSATVIIFGTGLCILFVAGIKVWYFFPIGIAGAGAITAYLMTHEYAMTRIRVWLDPFIDFRGKGWQGAQSFIAIGSGGFWGVGLGQGRQKHLYLPEPANDFIFSVWCEELGFVGAILVMVMFAYLIFRGFSIARNAKDKLGCLLATGIISKIAIQTLVNLCVVSGVMPVTGASLPFFSYGGTSLVIQLAEIGILLNISRQMKIGSLE